VNIADKLEQVGLRINEYRLESAVKQVSESPITLVEPLSVPKTAVVKDSGKGLDGHLNCQMDMFVHATEAVNAVVKTTGAFPQKSIKAPPILFVEKELLFRIPPQNHMVNRPRNVNTRFSGHGSS
jgi:hypothetical protein